MQATLLDAFTDNITSLEPRRVPVPDPAADEYLIRVSHISPQHADVLHANGKHQNVSKKGSIRLPFILGYDFAGIVERCPIDNAAFPKGSRVMGSSIGAFAQYICASDSRILPVPDSVSMETACASIGQSVSYAAVTYFARVQAGQTVLISGATGGLGSACCQFAKSVGATVIGLTTSSSRKPAVLASGANYAVETRDGWVQEVQRLTDGQGVDVVLDHTGMVEDALRVLKFGGTVVVIGFAARNGQMEKVAANRILLKGAHVIGLRYGEHARQFPARHARIQKDYLEFLRSTKHQPILYGSYAGLHDLGRALRDLQTHKAHGKIVIPLERRAKL